MTGLGSKQHKKIGALSKGNRTSLDEVRAWIEHWKTGVALRFVVGKRQCESERE